MNTEQIVSLRNKIQQEQNALPQEIAQDLYHTVAGAMWDTSRCLAIDVCSAWSDTEFPKLSHVNKESPYWQNFLHTARLAVLNERMSVALGREEDNEDLWGAREAVEEILREAAGKPAETMAEILWEHACHFTALSFYHRRSMGGDQDMYKAYSEETAREAVRYEQMAKEEVKPETLSYAEAVRYERMAKEEE
jgi:hypothetical protein